MKDVRVRPYDPGRQDRQRLDEWKKKHEEREGISLETPHGYRNLNTETAIATNAGKDVCSLTARYVISLDPLLIAPDANPQEVLQGLFKLEALLSYIGQTQGAVEAYIAVPNHMTEYQSLVRRCGYVITAENCTVFRRPLLPEGNPEDKQVS